MNPVPIIPPFQYSINPVRTLPNPTEPEKNSFLSSTTGQVSKEKVKFCTFERKILLFNVKSQILQHAE